MDDKNDDYIKFDSSGYCNYCNYALSRKDNTYFPNSQGGKEIEKMLKRIKMESKSKQFDCVMGISGGLDSSYLLYLGSIKWNLRILAIHVDDGFNTEIANKNIQLLSELPNVTLIKVTPNHDEYIDLIRSFILSGVPGIAVPQDNVMLSYLFYYIRRHRIKFFLSGANFALESILQKSDDGVPASDGKHIKHIHKIYGKTKIKSIKLVTLFQRYISQKFIHGIKTFTPLNYIDYNKNNAIQEMSEKIGFNYYGGKHHENDFTKFVQVYYLPKKFGFDKRKSHLSSLIVSDQLNRDEALFEYNKPAFDNYYEENELPKIVKSLDIDQNVFKKLMNEAPRKHGEFKKSIFIKFRKLAIKFRKVLDE